jgi:hypothetical protein
MDSLTAEALRRREALRGGIGRLLLDDPEADNQSFTFQVKGSDAHHNRRPPKKLGLRYEWFQTRLAHGPKFKDDGHLAPRAVTGKGFGTQPATRTERAVLLDIDSSPAKMLHIAKKLSSSPNAS